MTPKRAMTLAAGLGTRMRPLTNTMPKALVEVAGVSLLDRALDHLAAAGVTQAVVNLHHLGDMIAERVTARRRPEILLSREPLLLETGGGVAQALPLLGTDPFFVTSTDVIWMDGADSALRRLAAAWDDKRMDALLLVYPAKGALGYSGRGDFSLDGAGRLQRRPKDGDALYLFTTVQLLDPRLFDGMAVGVFSLNVCYDRAIAAGRAFGLVHDGLWAHVGTPEAIVEAEAFLARHQVQGAAT